MRNNWNVTFTVITEESAENGDYAETGFEASDVSFRDVLEFFGYPYLGYVEGNEWPITETVRWFTVLGDADLRTGNVRDVSLHIPEQITGSSRLRIARLLGCKIGAR